MLVGRAEEQEAIEALLREESSRPRFLVVRGEPGIGKSALLLDAAARATDREVLLASGMESEVELAFSGLFELVRPIQHLVAGLPARQAEALSGAFGLGPAIAGDRFVIGSALLALLAAAAEERPVLCVLDDAHWLDQASIEAVSFAARRLRHEQIVFLVAQRDDGVRRFDFPELQELTLRGLQAVDAVALLDGMAGEPLPREVVAQLVETTAGNPLALLELPAALTVAQRHGREPLPRPLLLGERVGEAFARRLDDLPEPTRRVLLLAAAEHSGSLTHVGHACDDFDTSLDAIEPAERGRIVEVDEASIRFRHPLLRAAAYQGAGSHERRRAHRALAEATKHHPEVRAWHLAGAALGPDENVAAELDIAAEMALARTGYSAAASAFERAATLSEGVTARASRLLRSAQATYMSGRVDEHVLDVLREAADLGGGALRFEAQLMRGRVEYLRNPRKARALLLEEVGLLRERDPARAAELAVSTVSYSIRTLDAHAALEDAQLARQLGDPGDPLIVVADFAARLLNGDVAGFAIAVESALALIKQITGLGRGDIHRGSDRYQLAMETLYAVGQAPAARHLIEPVEATSRGYGLTLATVLSVDLARIDYVTGRWDSARTRAAEAAQLGIEIGYTRYAWIALSHLAEIAATRGDEVACDRYSEDATDVRAEFGTLGHLGEGARALLALGAGHYDDAIDLYESAVLARPLPLQLWPEVADAAEASLRAGRSDGLDRASRFVEQAEAGGFPWAVARSWRLRGLMAPDDGFESCFQSSLGWHGRSDEPFQKARTELAYGERLRRAKRRTDARIQLRRALATFDRLGAAPWAMRARSELEATGERARRRDDWSTNLLTPQELHVALAVAGGATNKETAAELFLSPKTIEYHLRHVYMKLGLRSRSELARLFADDAAVAELAPH